MIPVHKLEAVVRRREEIDQLMCEPAMLADHAQLNGLNRERSHILPLVTAFQEWCDVTKQIKDDTEALDDPELGPLAREELPELEAKKAELERQIQILLCRATRRRKNTLLEIRAGTAVKRRRSSPRICSACTYATPNSAAGESRS